MIRVVLESPFGSDPDKFIPYGRACIRDSLSRGEAPMAMHLLYTQPGILDDALPQEREIGMRAGFDWYSAAQSCVVYRDFGISPGMSQGISYAMSIGLPVEYRSLSLTGFKHDCFNPFPRFDGGGMMRFCRDFGQGPLEFVK